MNTLLRFTVQNYRSIAAPHSLILTPKKKIADPPLTNVGINGRTKYLKTIAIYGANSSGKSNWVKAMGIMCSLIVGSNKNNPEEKLSYNPFMLDETSDKKPTEFDAEFITEGKHYRYGFSYDRNRICGEWLYQVLSLKNEQILFVRDLEGIGVNEDLFPEGKDKEEMTEDNRLFMPLVAQMKGEISKMIFGFFSLGFNVISGLRTDGFEEFTKVMLSENRPGSSAMKKFYVRAQLGFSDVNVRKDKFGRINLPDGLPDEAKKKLITIAEKHKDDEVLRAETTHGIYDHEGNRIRTKQFMFEDMESAGTRKLFQLSGPIFDTLNDGSVLVIDELDAKMHPLLSQELVRLFNDPERNPNGAQLIFTTHDTNLLSSKMLRRDQIWFTEKDKQERTDIYCMMQLKWPDGTTPRRDGNMERNYIRGRYGAVPYISPFND